MLPFFISWNYKNNFSCFLPFSFIPNYPANFRNNFRKTCWSVLIQTPHFFATKLITLKYWFLISITLAFFSVTIWYPTVSGLRHCNEKWKVSGWHPSIMAQSCLLGSQIEVEKKTIIHMNTFRLFFIP